MAAENRILKGAFAAELAAVGRRAVHAGEIDPGSGRKRLQQVARLAKPDTIFGWHRQLFAEKFDGSKHRRSPARPRVCVEIENLVAIRQRRTRAAPMLFRLFTESIPEDP
jgi:hypothetical protein